MSGLLFPSHSSLINQNATLTNRHASMSFASNQMKRVGGSGIARPVRDDSGHDLQVLLQVIHKVNFVQMGGLGLCSQADSKILRCCQQIRDLTTSARCWSFMQHDSTHSSQLLPRNSDTGRNDLFRGNEPKLTTVRVSGVTLSKLNNVITEICIFQRNRV